MKTLKFKTDIKCSGCVAKVSPHLNDAFGENNWEVDTNDLSKVLSVNSDTDSETVRSVVEKAGFRAETI